MMMKCALLLVVCLTAVFAFPSEEYQELWTRSMKRDATQCTSYTCSGLGQTCGPTGTTSRALCTTTNTWCNNNTVCTSAYEDNHFCTANNQCLQGSNCDWLDDANKATDPKYCQPVESPTYGVNGAYCTLNRNCASRLCQANLCVGKAVGQTCVSNFNCNSNTNAYCRNGTCAQYQPLGGSCVNPLSLCTGGTSCGPLQTCIVDFTLPAGAICVLDRQCPDGQACLLNPSGEYKCTTPPASSNLPCTTSCTQNNVTDEVCVCNPNTAQGVCTNKYTGQPAGVSAVGAKIRECYMGVCAKDQTSACAQANCVEAYCGYEQINLNKRIATLSAYPTCYSSVVAPTYTMPAMCPTTAEKKPSSDAVATSAAVTLVAAVATAVLLL